VRYAEVMEACLSGLRTHCCRTFRQHIASVASFFVSRVDTKIDPRLPEGSPLRGKAAIANAKLAYDLFQKMFVGRRWENIKVKGARVQRPLWASTSTKNPDYPDTIYVDNLIGPETVNTVPPATLGAVRDHGIAEVTLTRSRPIQRRARSTGSRGRLDGGCDAGTGRRGVKAFMDAFAQLMTTIDERRQNAVSS
jgi:transaldolase